MSASILKDLPVEYLSRGKYQPRRDFNEAALSELAESIRAQGVIEPIIVRETALNKYEIIAGERRWRASQLAGLDKVPCVIRKYSDEEAAEVTLIENIQREDLNPIEEALALSRLLDDFYYTHEEIASAIGKSRSKITNSLRLLHLDARVQQMLIDKILSEGHGKVLVSFSADQQYALAKKVVDDGWSVRQLEQLTKQEKSPVEPTSKDANIRRLEKAASDHFNAEVILDNNANNRSGWIKLKYQNYEVLSGILEKMGIDSD